MFLNIRTIVLALIISSTVAAQETENTENIKTETQQESNGSGKNIGNITVGPYFPIAFGNNFVNEGMNTKIGARLSFKFSVLKDFYIGPYFSVFKADVTNRELLGNYNKTTNLLVGTVVGYEKHINNFDISLGLGVGASTYRNQATFDNFNDTATSVWFNPEVSYRFSPFFGVYLAPELRHDFMNIDFPSELKDTFNGVNYVTISFGLRINLGSAYKYL